MGEPQPGNAALHIYARLASGLDALTEWSDRDHHRESLTRPGWLSIRRFAAVEAHGCRPYESFDLVTVITLANVDAAAMIADHSYTPTPMPREIVGLQAARAVYERVPADASGASADATGVAMLYVVTDFAPDDPRALDAWRARAAEPLSSALRDAGCLHVVHAQWRESPATTLARATTGPRVLAQYEVADASCLDAVAALLPTADGTVSRQCAAYRQVFPARGAYAGASNSSAAT